MTIFGQRTNSASQRFNPTAPSLSIPLNRNPRNASQTTSTSNPNWRTAQQPRSRTLQIAKNLDGTVHRHQPISLESQLNLPNPRSLGQTASHSGTSTNLSWRASVRPKTAQRPDPKPTTIQPNNPPTIFGTRQQQHGEASRELPRSSKGRDNQERVRNEDSSRPRSNQRYPLTFGAIKNLTKESTDPSDIVKRLMDEENGGLKKFLQENSAKNDAIELVIAVIGKFCAKNGPASFSNAFIKMIQILVDEVYFKYYVYF